MHNIILRCSCVQGVDNVWETSCISPIQIINVISKSSSLFSVDCDSNIVRYKKPFDLDDVFKVRNQCANNEDWVLIDNPKEKMVSEIWPEDISNMKRIFFDSSIPLQICFPSVENRFNFYTHDMGFYSCFFINDMSIEDVCYGLLNQIIQQKSKAEVEWISNRKANISFLVKIIKGGIAIDVDSILVNENEMSFLYYYFHDDTSKFGDFLFPKKPILCQQIMSITIQT